MKISIWIAFGSIAVVLTPTPAEALDPSTRISQYAHMAWRTQDGALRGTPHAIAQTTDGYLWIATDAGITRFDGVRFSQWVAPKGQTLSSPIIYSLLGGRDGTLWIGTARGLATWKNGISNNFTSPGRFNNILEDHAGAVWVARTRNGPTGGLCQADHGQLSCLGSSGDGLGAGKFPRRGQHTKPLGRQRE